MKVKDKTIIVTGAGSGMGRELTIQLVRKGAFVVMADINGSGMEETASVAGTDNVEAYILDISNRADVEKFASQILSSRDIDGVINNAGIIQPFVDVEELGYETIDRIFRINFFGLVYLTKALLPHLKTRHEAHIVNISSMGGYIPFPGQTVYSASKAAVKIFTEGLYAELKDSGVNVTVIHPGAVQTNISKNSGLEVPETSEEADFPALPASEAASQIIAGMEKDKFRVTVGKDARMLDIFYRISPKRAVDFIVKKMGGLR